MYMCGGGILFVDATHDVNRFKVGFWGTILGRRVFHCSPFVKTQQEAELEAIVRGVRPCINVGWLVWRLIRDNQSALGQVAAMRAGEGLKRGGAPRCGRGEVATLPTCGPLLILPPALKRWGSPMRQG